jgi:hypothetical protein
MRTIPSNLQDADSAAGPRARLAVAARRTYVAALTLFVVLGLFDVFGSRTGVASASGGGYRMALDYPAETRSGLPVEWRLVVTHPGGFDGPVRVGITLDYFNSFDFNNVSPTPVETSNRGGLLIWSFPKPIGDTLVVLLDARTQPGLRSGPSATTAVVAEDGTSIVAVHTTTGVMP